jgi:hypothetical protein
MRQTSNFILFSACPLQWPLSQLFAAFVMHQPLLVRAMVEQTILKITLKIDRHL